MKLFRVGALFLLVGAAACTNDTAGSISALPPLAGLRYMAVVPDTGALDFRIVDIVAYAPNQTAATFRAGGLQDGISTSGFNPLPLATAAGTHIITVFLNSTIPTVASTVLRADTVTLTAGLNYTYYLFGYAKPADGTPALTSVLTVDSATVAAGNISVRVLNLAGSLAGNPAGIPNGNLDGRVALTTVANPLPGAANYSNLAPGNLSSYVSFPVTAAGTVYRLAVTPTGFATPIAFQANLPVGTAGNSTTQPVPGTAVAGTGITAILVPQSVVGTGAPQTAAASTSTNIDSLTRSNDTVTVWRHITPGNGGAASPLTCNTAVAAGPAANDILAVSGATQPEFNGSVSVISVTAGTSQTVDTSRQTVTLGGGVAGNTFTLKYGANTTGAIAYDETPAGVQAALGALASIGGVANVKVTGPTGGPYVIVFIGTFLGTNPVTTLVATPTGGVLTAAVAVSYNCLGAATSSRFRYRLNGTTPVVSPATGAPKFKIVTAGTADFTIPTVLYMIDVLPARTAP
ncbi:MAG: hypothetical protein ACHQX4_08965 [Gemmatimonadales bacterium]